MQILVALLNCVAILLIFSGQDAPCYAADQRVALIISNANYHNTAALANPPLDAEGVLATLRNMGFDDVEVLNDATADVMRKKLRDFALKARLSSVAVIYYAGHGLEADGQNFFVPVDARLETDLDIAFETVSIDLAVRAVNGAKTLKLLILDACRDNPLSKGIRANSKSRSIGTGLAPVNIAGDVVVSYSAAAGQVAYDGSPGEYSPFAKALVQHLPSPGVDIRKVLGRIRDNVLDATKKKQNPFIYASLGGEEIYLVNPPRGYPGAPLSPVTVDVAIADPEDEAVSNLLAGDTKNYFFPYEMNVKTTPSKSISVLPKLDYFVSSAQRGRPLIFAKMYGYFSPEEGAGWGLGYPLLDIIARRALPRVVTLSEILVEVESSTFDPNPYFGIITPSDRFATIVIFNEGWTNVKSAKIEYDILGFEEPSRRMVEQWVSAREKGGYKYSTMVGKFDDYAYVSLADGLKSALPDFQMYAYSFDHPPWERDAKGKLKKSWRGAPKGYADWLKANPISISTPSIERAVWVVGRVTLEPSGSEVSPTVAEFCAPLAVQAPEGLGGGGIDYNLKHVMALKAEGQSYAVRRSIGYLLDQDTKTFRGLFPLTVDRTSRHRFRVSIVGDGGQNLYASDWINALVVVPRLSKRAAAFAKGGYKGRKPFRGID